MNMFVKSKKLSSTRLFYVCQKNYFSDKKQNSKYIFNIDYIYKQKNFLNLCLKKKEGLRYLRRLRDELKSDCEKTESLADKLRYYFSEIKYNQRLLRLAEHSFEKCFKEFYDSFNSPTIEDMPRIMKIKNRIDTINKKKKLYAQRFDEYNQLFYSLINNPDGDANNPKEKV